MDNFREICLNEMEELEELVCLGSGGTVACCNGRDGNLGVGGGGGGSW